MKRLIAITLCIVFCFVACSAYAATKGEQNALESAKLYLSFMNFSYKGLCGQLEYDGYSSAEAKYAADNCGADWYDQAAGCANNYISFMSFSKKGLIEQLEYEGFTTAEAEYGAAIAYGEKANKPGAGNKKASEPAKITTKPTEKVTEIPSTPVSTTKLNKSGASYDLTGLTFEELINLQYQVNQALWASEGWQEVLVPAGLYRVGVEIPAGDWKVSKTKSWARIKIGSAVNATGNEVDSNTRDFYTVQINDEVPSQTITFKEGMYVEIYNAELIFNPATGPSFSFK